MVHSLILQPVSAIALDTEADLAAFAHEYVVPIITR